MIRRSDVSVCKWMGWSYPALLATPMDVVISLWNLIEEQAS